MDKRAKNQWVQDIGYGFLENIAFGMIVLFSVNPFFQMLFREHADYFSLMTDYNRYVLMFGVFIFLVYFVKLRVDEKIPHLKSLFKKHVPVTLLLVFGVWMLVTTLLNGAPEITILGDSYREEGLLGFWSYLIYFMMAAFMLSERRKKIISYVFVVSATLVGCVIFADYIFFDVKYNYATGADMILHNSNHLGYYLLVAVMFHGMFFVTTKNIWLKMIHMASFMLMTVVLIMNDTWGCQLALIIGAVFVIIVYSIGTGHFRPITTLLLIAIAVTVLLAYTTNDRLKENIENNMIQQLFAARDIFDLDGEVDDSLGSGRMRLWKYTLQYIGERPLLGHGADVTGSRLNFDAGSDRCHCEFLNYAVSFGVPAAIVYIVSIFMMYLRGLYRKEQLTEMNYVGLCVAFAYLVSSSFGNTMYYTAPYLFIALGMGYVRDSQ